MIKPKNNTWNWKNLEVSWSIYGDEIESTYAILLIHGFGACKEHWRKNQPILGQLAPCYAIDLIGFGNSSQPQSRISNEQKTDSNFCYNFDNWSNQVIDFCKQVINKPTIIIGNSIGGVIGLLASKNLKEDCKGLILINCAQRRMDDKQLSKNVSFMKLIRPLLKVCISQRFLSKTIFNNVAQPNIIKKILEQAYPSQRNIDEELITILHRPTLRVGASEAFRGFINNFNDHLAQQLMENIKVSVFLIWGENDPWEPIDEAKKWLLKFECIKSLNVIQNAGHCPHDESPKEVNDIISRLVQEAI